MKGIVFANYRANFHFNSFYFLYIDKIVCYNNKVRTFVLDNIIQQKEKKINKAEEELNQQVFENIKIGEDRTYNRRDNYHQKGKKHGKFQYNPDEFQEL